MDLGLLGFGGVRSRNIRFQLSSFVIFKVRVTASLLACRVRSLKILVLWFLRESEGRNEKRILHGKLSWLPSSISFQNRTSHDLWFYGYGSDGDEVTAAAAAASGDDDDDDDALPCPDQSQSHDAEHPCIWAPSKICHDVLHQCLIVGGIEALGT